jgi:hypothetical protein
MDADHPTPGALQINWPDREPGDMPPTESCALDVADRGGATLEEVGRLLNVSRQSVAEIEAYALAQLRGDSLPRRRAVAVYGEFAGEGRVLSRRMGVQTGLDAAVLTAQMTPAEAPDDAEEETEPVERISFFAESEDADDRVADSVWRMVERKHGIKSQASRQMTAYRARMQAEKAKGGT